MQHIRTRGEEQGNKQRILGETMLWEIWKERCRAIHNGDSLKPENVIKLALKVAEETWNTKQIRIEPMSRGRNNQSGEVWKKPKVGKVKINIDTSLVAATKKGGTSVVTMVKGGLLSGVVKGGLLSSGIQHARM